MPIIRRTRPCITTYGVLHWLCWLWLCAAGSYNQCRTPYAVIHGLVLLMMDIMMPETCWDRSLIINIGLIASCWFISLHPSSFIKYQILLIPVKDRRIISSPKGRGSRKGPNRHCGPRSFILNVHRRSLPWIKRLKSEINHKLLSGVEVTNKWNSMSIRLYILFAANRGTSP